MNRYPLSDLAATPEVRQAKRFRKAAGDMTGEGLGASYTSQQQSGGGGLVEPVLSAARAPRGEIETTAAHLVEHCKKGERLDLSDERAVDLIARGVQAADSDAGKIDLLGLDGENRLVVVALRHTAADASRCAVGDTPLRLLIEGLASCALAEGEQAAIRAALEAEGRTPIEDPPVLLVLATPRYWELCRKREAQSGAAWINELERLGREIESHIGVTVEYLALETGGDGDEPAGPSLVRAWEAGAGTVKVRAKSTSRATPAEVIIEADPSRPPRAYAPSEQYQPGDQIAHTTLGSGVVQRVLGPSKVEVMFDGERRLLVQGRPPPPS